MGAEKGQEGVVSGGIGDVFPCYMVSVRVFLDKEPGLGLDAVCWIVVVESKRHDG